MDLVHQGDSVTHEEGKLSYRNDGSIGSIEGEGGDIIAQASPVYRDTRTQDQRKANARRIVACWNSCGGISTEVLEEALTTSDQPLLDAAMYAEVMEKDRDYAVILLSECLKELEIYKANGWKDENHLVSAVGGYIEEVKEEGE